MKIGRVNKSTKTKVEIMATRQEHAIKIAKKIVKIQRKSFKLHNRNVCPRIQKKPNGSWHISKIAKDSGTTRPTVMKYLPKETLF